MGMRKSFHWLFLLAQLIVSFKWECIDGGLVQERRNSSALAMELRLSCTNPSALSSWTLEWSWYELWRHWQHLKVSCHSNCRHRQWRQSLYHVNSQFYRSMPSVLSLTSIIVLSIRRFIDFVTSQSHGICLQISQLLWIMMTSSSENIFRDTGPLLGESTGYRWIPLTKASDADLWGFLWSLTRTSGWTNNRDAADFRRQRTHYDVTVMYWQISR